MTSRLSISRTRRQKQNGILATATHLNEYMSPRLVGIRSDGNDEIQLRLYECVRDPGWRPPLPGNIRLQTSGQIISAKLLDTATTGLTINQPYYSDALNDAYGIAESSACR